MASNQFTTAKKKEFVRKKFPNADWLVFCADGIYAEGKKIADGDTPSEAWEKAYWAVRLGHV